MIAPDQRERILVATASSSSLGISAWNCTMRSDSVIDDCVALALADELRRIVRVLGVSTRSLDSLFEANTADV